MFSWSFGLLFFFFVFVIFIEAVGLCVVASFYYVRRSSGKVTNIELQVVGMRKARARK